MRIGILRETKSPPDKRVPFTPEQLSRLVKQYPEHEFVVQSSCLRAFSDEEYMQHGIGVKEQVVDCDVLFGVKEVDPETFSCGKTYFFFSHTAKLQPHNQDLLRRASAAKITLIDYEYLTDSQQRVVAFGYWAGIVGAYNALRMISFDKDSFLLKAPELLKSKAELLLELQQIKALRFRIVITGEGRVAAGASEILESAGYSYLSPEGYSRNTELPGVFTKIGPQHYTSHVDERPFDFQEFIAEPQNFKSAFQLYARNSDMLIACHFWDNRSPVFFSAEDMQKTWFRIRWIADISCDIPGPIPSTLRPSSITQPFYGVSREVNTEIPPFTEDEITVMAVDNLPGCLPRDASEDFGEGLIKHVIPSILGQDYLKILSNATILKDGKLTPPFNYMKDYLGF